MKGNSFRYIIVGFIIIAIAGAIHLSRQKRVHIDMYKARNSVFVLTDTSIVDKIELQHEGKTQIFENKKAVWQGLNKDSYKLVFDVLTNTQSLNQVPESKNDDLMILLRTKGVKINCYSGGVLLKSMYCYLHEKEQIMAIANDTSGKIYFVKNESFKASIFEQLLTLFK